MYEAPEYWELKKVITHFENVRRYVDMARKFRAMSYGASLMLTSENGQYSQDAAHEVLLKDSLRTDVLEFLAQRCEDIAAGMSEGEIKPIDVRRACKV